MTGTFSFEERYGCTKILNLMSTDRLLSLHHTVTNKETRRIFTSEAIDDIISNSMNAEELLKRRKVQRDIIFTYLQNEGLVMDKNSDKPKLVKQALAHWFVAQNRQPPKVRSCDSSSSTTVTGGYTDPVVRISSTHISKPPSSPAPTHNSPVANPMGFTSQNTASIQPDRCKHSIFSSMPTNDSVDTNLVTMGQQFCQWFYMLLNSLNPVLGQGAENFQPQHFWEDVKLRLRSSTGIEEYEGAELASQRLLALARDERLLLSPNLEPHGLRALSSPHGLVLVAVAGTIHRDTACLGIYEQVFGLIRSPLDNNQWKIKFTEVRMLKSDELSVGNGLVPPSLTWDASELQRLLSFEN